LRLLADYGTRERAVELIGEAVFTVTHDERRPFTVYTDLLVARDLGTRFVVRVYPGDLTGEVVVAEGVVAVARDSSALPHVSDSALLKRGDRARMMDDGHWAITRNVPLDSYFDWTQGRLVFRDVSLGEAVARLERWYDIDIHLASAEIATLRFAASFEQTYTAADALQVIADALELQVERDNRGYTLSTK
jgi:ferric-dicitrate binding protein FerR (iron transport regulator)